MKSCLFLLAVCVLGAVGASGQTIGSYFLSGQPQMLVMPEHPQHATQTPLAQEQDLREQSTYIYAQGERPVWEFMPAPSFVPIADVARTLRNQHAKATKAVVFRND